VALRLLNQGVIPVVKSQRANGFTLIETMIVLGLIGVISAIAVPMFANAIAGFRLSGDARSLSNAAAVAKMRAASDFTRVRLFVDLTGRTHHIETWDKTASHWTPEGGTTTLSTGVSFSYGVVATAPPSTQATIGQAASCTADDGTVIAGTACIMFNSRGVAIDSTLAPTGADALYVTDGMAVYGITVASTGMLRLWRTLPTSTPTWTHS
jgi:prepilin-type N-terminal cleavage/methylation domain-containing protein